MRCEPWHYPGNFHFQENQGSHSNNWVFLKVIIWFLAIGQIMNNLTNFVAYIAYGAGFATGTYLGMDIEEKISPGLVSVRIITKKDRGNLCNISGYIIMV